MGVVCGGAWGIPVGSSIWTHHSWLSPEAPAAPPGPRPPLSLSHIHPQAPQCPPPLLLGRSIPSPRKDPPGPWGGGRGNTPLGGSREGWLGKERVRVEAGGGKGEPRKRGHATPQRVGGRLGARTLICRCSPLATGVVARLEVSLPLRPLLSISSTLWIEDRPALYICTVLAASSVSVGISHRVSDDGLGMPVAGSTKKPLSLKRCGAMETLMPRPFCDQPTPRHHATRWGCGARPAEFDTADNSPVQARARTQTQQRAQFGHAQRSTMRSRESSKRSAQILRPDTSPDAELASLITSRVMRVAVNPMQNAETIAPENVLGYLEGCVRTESPRMSNFRMARTNGLSLSSRVLGCRGAMARPLLLPLF